MCQLSESKPGPINYCKPFSHGHWELTLPDHCSCATSLSCDPKTLLPHPGQRATRPRQRKRNSNRSPLSADHCSCGTQILAVDFALSEDTFSCNQRTRDLTHLALIDQTKAVESVFVRNAASTLMTATRDANARTARDPRLRRSPMQDCELHGSICQQAGRAQRCAGSRRRRLMLTSTADALEAIDILRPGLKEAMPAGV